MATSRTGRFQRGTSGNPGGAPKGYVSFAAMLRRELMATDSRDRTNLQRICDAVVARAVKGDLAAAQWIAERVDGKVAQSLDVRGEGVVHVVPWLPAVADAASAQLVEGDGELAVCRGADAAPLPGTPVDLELAGESSSDGHPASGMAGDGTRRSG